MTEIYNALLGGHYLLTAALIVVVVTGLLRKFGGPTSWVHTDAGGTALALVTATAASLAVTMAVPAAVFTFSILWTSLALGVTAAGGYAALKNLLVDPILRQLALRSPAWSQPVFKFVFFIFDSKAAAPVPEVVVVTAPLPLLGTLPPLPIVRTLVQRPRPRPRKIK